MDPKQIVARGYDRIAERYSQWVNRTRTDERDRYASLLLQQLPTGAAVLELGCGAGIPTTRKLAQRCKVTGIDLSERHIELARRNVPGATFSQADMTKLVFPPASFDTVVAFYSIIHVPRAEHPQLLHAIATCYDPEVC